MNLSPEASLTRLRRVAWGAAALFSLGGLFFGIPVFLGVFSGGLLATANFEGLGRFVGNLGEERPSGSSWLGVFGLLFRYILLCSALFVIIGVWRVNVVALAVGFSAPVAAVFVECVIYAYRESKTQSETRDSEARQ